MKCTKMLGWLVMAAALSFTACSSEDNLTQEPSTQQPTQTATNIHVSVGAGIDNAATRSTVDYNSSTKTRTLKFTVGDKLYIYREILGDGTLRLTGELTMSQLSAEAKMDVVSLFEMMMAEIYKSPRELVRISRLQRAAGLLKTTDMEIKDIAAECKFYTPNYLMGCFFHQYKLTPAEFREMNR